jgi:hypothetical protein
MQPRELAEVDAAIFVAVGLGQRRRRTFAPASACASPAYSPAARKPSASASSSRNCAGKRWYTTPARCEP